MIEGITNFFVKYAKTTSLFRMVVHMFVFCFAITFAAIIILLVTKFDTLETMVNRLAAPSEIIHDVNDAARINVQVHALLEEQRLIFDVDRLYVDKLHDGKTDLNGVHFFFFSRVSESVAPGVSRELIRSQNLPLGVFPGMISSHLKGECYFTEKVEPGVENYEYLLSFGIQSTLICPVRDATGKLIGSIGVDAVRFGLNTQDRARIEARMIPLASVLGGLLSIK